MNTTRLSQRNGQSLVEMALLLPLLLVLSVVTIDLGRGVYYYSAIYNAAREGARYGIINPEDTTGINNAARRLTVGLNQGQLHINPCECGKTCIAATSCPVGAKNIIHVEVTYTFQLVTPLANLVLGTNSFPLKSTSMMVIER